MMVLAPNLCLQKGDECVLATGASCLLEQHADRNHVEVTVFSRALQRCARAESTGSFRVSGM